jgi:hypothetical protein
MSNTPRTDICEVKMERLDGDFDHVVSADFARQLERELAEAQATLVVLAANCIIEHRK